MIANSSIAIFQVDAFTEKPFSGNPAGVCITDEPLAEDLMQQIAMEMNLSETAFATPTSKGGHLNTDKFNIRWFTPTCEVSLCGHATLAAAKVLYDIFDNSAETLTFMSKAGNLYVSRRAEYIQLDFPAAHSEPASMPDFLAHALRLESTGLDRYYVEACKNTEQKSLLLRFREFSAIKSINPDFLELIHAQQALGYREIILTARGEGKYDFASRIFAPLLGIDEDPVSGAPHTLLTPYWAALLNKKHMIAFQASKRGGEMIVELHSDPKGIQDRVLLLGKAVIVIEGIINMPDI